jgi:hypothetical protein
MKQEDRVLGVLIRAKEEGGEVVESKAVVLVDCACQSLPGLSGTAAAVRKHPRCVYVPQHFH